MEEKEGAQRDAEQDRQPQREKKGDYSREKETEEIEKIISRSQEEIGQSQRAYERCIGILKEAVFQDDYINHIMYSLEERGCSVQLGKFFHCKDCVEPAEGYWDQDEGIVICQNYVQSKQRVIETLRHELIHAYDECRAEVDWSNCEHHACTEIRAANLSGDCTASNELNRGHLIGWQARQKVSDDSSLQSNQECVRRRALLSIQHQDHCRGTEGVRAVDKVFNDCYYDTEPFDHAP